MVRGARRNLRASLGDGETVRGDATALPVPDDGADAVVFDAPYGRQSKVVGELRGLLEGALAEARRLAPRAVVVADRDWREAARAAGWTPTDRFERRVHGSLVRHVLVLEA
jgi:tRNA (guanine10-N2)-dimethyltransferase